MSEKINESVKCNFNVFKRNSEFVCKKLQVKVYSEKNNQIALVKDVKLFDFDDINKLDISNFIIIEDENNNKKWLEIYELRALIDYLYLLSCNKSKKIDKNRIEFINNIKSERNYFTDTYFSIPRNNIDVKLFYDFMNKFDILINRFENNE